MYVHVHLVAKQFISFEVHNCGYCVCTLICLQVVNGLMEREDWESAIKVPIGMLPTGSGNALVSTTLHESE